jgi:hypothetical protein
MVVKPRISILRSAAENATALKRHFDQLGARHGGVHAVSLLEHRGREAVGYYL